VILQRDENEPTIRKDEKAVKRQERVRLSMKLRERKDK